MEIFLGFFFAEKERGRHRLFSFSVSNPKNSGPFSKLIHIIFFLHHLYWQINELLFFLFLLEVYTRLSNVKNNFIVLAS